MNEKLENQLVHDLRRLDRPINLDAAELTSKISKRRQHDTKLMRRRVIAAASVAMIAMATWLGQPYTPMNKTVEMGESMKRTNRLPSIPELFTVNQSPDAMASRLRQMEAKLEALRAKQTEQQIAFVKETLSRSLFATGDSRTP